MLLTTREIARTNIDIVNIELEPVMGFNSKEKNTVLGSLAFPVITASIPKKPKIKRKGNTTKKAEAKPMARSLLLFAEKTLCQIPWSNKFVANTAIKKVKPAV